ncbi:AAA family ATPase [Sinorhizobium meliloti]|uniref:AAA family ATPase n=2 Tax=Rhizobium meliloti TaxID=382 RepID=UPI00129806E9|nr:ATP-binding protein [Sinorhizobium meliloti]MDW9378024.1 AAA family ATPase [Sinorhizobium meliloti]MDW9496625.1 AAA family ATPase [Sinorhizobium meliloti]MDW9565177.1 AAA family ATPase [Sinorhizobium meliloti]MDW9652603.1 AAA family ATPase [Sinorhizobium meliloti]MDW9862815.1 AAA family ATPase [Sinorhizobium meliloti]
MQFFDRGSVQAPASLSNRQTSQGRRHLEEIFSASPHLRAQTRVSMASVTLDNAELNRALSRLFRGRCAFCESSTATRAYRFRPTEEAGPSGAAPEADAPYSHLYYCWLANSWQNIYAICAECYPREPSIFPVTGQRCRIPTLKKVRQYVSNPSSSWPDDIEEKPLFLDPCQTRDYRQILAAVPTGVLVALSPRGQATIEHFNLNRENLTESRKTRLAQYFGRLLEQVRSGADIDPSFEFPNLEFGGSWYLLLYQLAAKISDGNGSRPVLSQQRIINFFRQRASADQAFARRMQEAFGNLRDMPEQLNKNQRRSAGLLKGDARPIKFTIKNYKALEALEVTLKASTAVEEDSSEAGNEERAPALVILGENAAGKSSVLEAMALALSSQATRDQLTLEPDLYMLNPNYMGRTDAQTPREGSVSVTYENGLTASVRIGEGFSFSDGEFIPRIPVFAYGAFRMYLKDERKASRSTSPIRSLFEANHILPNPEKWLLSISGDPIFAEVSRALKYVLAVEQEVDIIEVDTRNRECFLIMTNELPRQEALQVRTPLKSVSSGFRSVLAMICDVMRGLIAQQDRMSASLARARAVVIIDEVEAHLHPKWKMRIIEGLRQALPNVTFIFSTHDPLCLRGLSSDDVRVFRRLRREVKSNSRALPSYVEQLEQIPAIGVLTIEQLLTSDLFQLHSTDSPDVENQLARAGDILAQAKAGEDPDDAAVAGVRSLLRAQIGRALPIGSSEVEQLVQDAVETYLIRRRSASQSQLSNLRGETREEIISALERF